MTLPLRELELVVLEPVTDALVVLLVLVVLVELLVLPQLPVLPLPVLLVGELVEPCSADSVTPDVLEVPLPVGVVPVGLLGLWPQLLAGPGV